MLAVNFCFCNSRKKQLLCIVCQSCVALDYVSDVIHWCLLVGGKQRQVTDPSLQQSPFINPYGGLPADPLHSLVSWPEKRLKVITIKYFPESHSSPYNGFKTSWETEVAWRPEQMHLQPTYSLSQNPQITAVNTGFKLKNSHLQLRSFLWLSFIKIWSCIHIKLNFISGWH